MKILVIMPFSPVPPVFGGAIRQYYLLKSLTEKHEVTILTHGTSKDYLQLNEAFKSSVKEIHVIPHSWHKKYKRLSQWLGILLWDSSYFKRHMHTRAMQKKIDELFKKHNFDAVHCEFPTMGSYRFPDNTLKVLDTHNVEYENFRRMWRKSSRFFSKWYYFHEYMKVYQEEIEILKKQDCILTTSENDKKIFLKDITHVPFYTIPNGVDTRIFTPKVCDIEQKSIVFTGSLGYTPNNDGMLYFLDEIFPLIQEQIPDIKIYIVGSSPKPELRRRANKNIIVTGFVDDVRPYVWRSSVFVVPLRMGSGTRLKVLEALAMQKPVVSTTLGCEGIDVEHGKSILIADEPKQFADSVVNLILSPIMRRYLAEDGYQIIKEKYEWSAIGKSMLTLYDKLEQKKTKPNRILV